MKSCQSMLAASVLATLLLASGVWAQGPRTDVLVSGERGRSYHEFGSNLVKLLPAFRLENRISSGSVENLGLLADGKADLGFAQADVYARSLRIAPDRYSKLVVVGRLVEECVYLVRSREGSVENLKDLGEPVAGRAAKVAVGSEGSGMSATWSLLSTLTPTLADAEVVHTGGVLSLNQLGLGLLDAVAWVSDPQNHSHVLLRAALGDPKLDLLPITDPALEHALDDGTPIYRLRRVKLSDDDKGPELETLCTGALVLASPTANPRLVEATSQALSLHRNAILGWD